MKTGTKKARRDLAVFLLVFSVLLAFASPAVDNGIAFAWLGLLALASVVMLWRSWRARHDSELSRAFRDARWGSVIPPKVFRWMIGEDEDSKAARERRDRRDENEK